MVKPSQVYTEDITPEMLKRAYKIYDHQRSENYYLVESSNFAENDEEYEVRYSKEHSFTCNCKSGQNGFYNTKHGYCSHVAIAVAHAKEEKALQVPAPTKPAWNAPSRVELNGPSWLLTGIPHDRATGNTIYPVGYRH